MQKSRPTDEPNLATVWHNNFFTFTSCHLYRPSTACISKWSFSKKILFALDNGTQKQLDLYKFVIIYKLSSLPEKGLFNCPPRMAWPSALYTCEFIASWLCFLRVPGRRGGRRRECVRDDVHRADGRRRQRVRVRQLHRGSRRQAVRGMSAGLLRGPYWS